MTIMIWLGCVRRDLSFFGFRIVHLVVKSTYFVVWRIVECDGELRPECDANYIITYAQGHAVADMRDRILFPYCCARSTTSYTNAIGHSHDDKRARR